MYCRNCGSQIDDNSDRCAHCGQVLQPTGSPLAAPQEIPNYLVQAILVTVLCCLPFGVPAIVFAAQVNGFIRSGDFPAAIDASRKARLWCWVSFWLGVSWIVIYLAFVAMTFLWRLGAMAH
jgi:hypothetical protein